MVRSEQSSGDLPYDISNNRIYTKNFIEYLLVISGETGLLQANAVDTYIYGNVHCAMLGETSMSATKNWSEYISYRLTRVLNTYWDLDGRLP